MVMAVVVIGVDIAATDDLAQITGVIIAVRVSTVAGDVAILVVQQRRVKFMGVL